MMDNNSLFINFSDKLADVPGYVNEYKHLDNVYIIANSPVSNLVNYKIYLNYRDCIFGKFSSQYLDLPLESNLLNKMSYCEYNVLKMMERYQFSKKLLTYEARINLYHRQLRFWYNFLMKEDIKVCYFAVIPHVVFDFVIYELCKYLGIQTIILYRAPVLPDKNVSLYVLYDLKEHIPNLKKYYNEHIINPSKSNLSTRMMAYLDLKNGNENKTFTGVVLKKRQIKKYFYLKNYINYFKYFMPWMREWFKLWGHPIDVLYRFIYLFSYISKPNFESKIDLTQKYVFVSLHYQPECTTSPMGGVFVHQDLMIDLLLKFVPREIKIYIKAHPREGLSKTLRKRLSFDERTILIDAKINSFLLIKNSLAVSTITSTSAF